MFMANDGNYREQRWFSSWTPGKVVDFDVPDFMLNVKHKRVKFGDSVLRGLGYVELFEDF